MKYYIIAGEASGDLHGSNLMKGLLEADPKADFRFWGGELMESVGGKLVKHYKETAIIGFVEVLLNLNKISENFKLCKSDLLAYNPDVLILIDYPGFNFRMARFAKKNNIKVFYYISPKVWAWKESRIKYLKRDVDRLFIIFPFEIEYFDKKGIKAIYHGNPLLDSTSAHPCNLESKEEFLQNNNLLDKPIIGLLAGSRTGEIEYLMPRILKLEQFFPNHQLLLASAPSMDENIYSKYLVNSSIKLIKNQTYSVLKHSEAAVISSGTASLEAALLDCPQVVCYGGNEITYQIAKRLVKLKYISLVNLILNKAAVKELIQRDCTPEKIAKELHHILKGKERQIMKNNYKKLRSELGGEGASLKVADAMVKELRHIIDNTHYTAHYQSPIGLLEIVCDNQAILKISYIDRQTTTKSNDNSLLLEEAVKQLREYFAEQRDNFDLPYKLTGTDFQNRVWTELAKIPYGKSKTYGEIANLVDSKDANRAVGMACKMNPLLIIVPCHRVLGAHNKLTGFNIGLDKKSYLLGLEKTYLNTDKNIFSNDNQSL